MAIFNTVFGGELSWKPLNPKCWYKFDGDYSDTTGTFGDASGTSTFQTLASGVKVLQTDGTNVVLLPTGVTADAITTYTISFRMKTLTTSPNYGYYVGCGANGGARMSFYENTSGRNFFEWGASDSTNYREITPSGLTTGWRMVTIRSNGTARSNLQLLVNCVAATTGGSGGSDSSSIFGYTGSKQFTIGARVQDATASGQRTSIQFSNLVISHSYWDDTQLQDMYDNTKSLYGIS